MVQDIFLLAKCRSWSSTFGQKASQNPAVQGRYALSSGAGPHHALSGGRARTDDRTLTLRLLTESSPYQRVIEEASRTSLSGFLARGDTTATPSWTGSAQSYVASKQQKHTDALSKISGQLGVPPPGACMKLGQEVSPKAAGRKARPVLVLGQYAGCDQSRGRPEGNTRKPDEDIGDCCYGNRFRNIWRFILRGWPLFAEKAGRERDHPVKGLPQQNKSFPLRAGGR